MNCGKFGAGIIWLGLTASLAAGTLNFKEVLKVARPAADAKSVTVDFEFSNTSGKPVRILKYKPSCVCLTLNIKEGKLHYAPGESGLIRVEFALGGFSGVVSKIAVVWVDDDPPDKPSIQLTVTAHIPALVTIEPKSLIWELNDKPTPKTLKIAMSHHQPIRVTAVRTASAAFKHELKIVTDGSAYELVITPLDSKAPAFANYKITTDCEIEQHRQHQIFAVVRNPIQAKAAAKP